MNIQRGVGEDRFPGRFTKHDLVLRKHPLYVPLLFLEYLLCLLVPLLFAVVKLLNPDDKHLRNPEEDPSGDQEGIVLILASFARRGEDFELTHLRRLGEQLVSNVALIHLAPLSQRPEPPSKPAYPGPVGT